MGGCVSASDSKPQSRSHDKENRPVSTDKAPSRSRDIRKEAKLVLLGPGESGKSTLFKQMKIIESNMIPEDERRMYVNAVYANIISQMKQIAEVARKQNINLANPNNEATIAMLVATSMSSSNWTEELGRQLQQLWTEEQVKRIYEERGKTYQINDGAGYLFDHLQRINGQQYLPTVDDYLRVRIRTTGSEEAVFPYQGVQLRVTDVGGQRIERRRWREAIDGATAFIFCASLSEYDLVLREDEMQNRMKETLLMFEEIVTGELTARTPVILLLNKTDLFRAKLSSRPLTLFWPAYAGSNTFEAATQFVRQQFLDLAPPGAEVYSHFTCAIDTENIRIVWKDVRETIYKKLLKKAGGAFLM